MKRKRDLMWSDFTSTASEKTKTFTNAFNRSELQWQFN